MSPELPEPPVAAPPPRQPWAWPAAWVAVVLIVVSGAVFTFRSCTRMPVEMMRQTTQVLNDVASAFRRGTIVTSFFSYATTVTNYHYLQFATFKQTEVFTRKEEASTGFGYIPLPDVVVEARAPVEYTYYLDLNEKWQFELRDHVIHVITPPIRANKPAVDASAISYEVRKGFLKTDAAQENLKKSITSLVAARARDNLALVRETGRRQVAEFVERWLARSFVDGAKYPVKVYFPDEPLPADIRLEVLPPK